MSHPFKAILDGLRAVNEADTRSEFEKVGEDMDRMEVRCAELCKTGYAHLVTTTLENIIRDNRLRIYMREVVE